MAQENKKSNKCLVLVPTKESIQEIIDIFGVVDDKNETKSYKTPSTIKHKTPSTIEHLESRGYKISNKNGILDVWEDFIHCTIQKYVSLEKIKSLKTKLKYSGNLQATFTTELKGDQEVRESERTLWTIEAENFNVETNQEWMNLFNKLGIPERAAKFKPHITIQKYQNSKSLKSPTMKRFVIKFDRLLVVGPGKMDKPDICIQFERSPGLEEPKLEMPVKGMGAESNTVQPKSSSEQPELSSLNAEFEKLKT